MKWLALLFTCVSLFAAAPKAAPPHARSGTSSPAAPDAVIEQKIRDKFAKSKISANKFQVRVQGGAATIEGNTDVIQHKGTATRLAKSAGARTVVNKIQISDAARQKAASNLEKGRNRGQSNSAAGPKRAEIRR